MQNILLDTKMVGNIQGHFLVPAYQRGYRWSSQEVERLVEDIKASDGKPYCLQPIVVKKLNELDGENAQYELIDGQQRLTTLYLLYKYFSEAEEGNYFKMPRFTLEYDTREDSKTFLQNLHLNSDPSKAKKNIDFWYIDNAYKTISRLLPNDYDTNDEIYEIHKNLKRTISVIWYEVPNNEDSISLFQRLNIGKIQLTASELVKALFLRENTEDGIKSYQEEIALQWDNIERDLHNENLWSFLTNRSSRKYATRIDLILDLMPKEGENEKDPLRTFFHFDNLSKEKKLYDVWKDIQAVFLQLKDWYADHELYHKIGYLIASGYKTLKDIHKQSEGKRKREFKDSIEEMIKESVSFEGDILDLNYRDNYDVIKRILLLFNVESVRRADEGKQWFSFSKHKQEGSSWSLEHIHAQQSEGLDTNEKRATWIEAHLTSLKSLQKSISYTDNGKTNDIDSLIGEMENLHADLLNPSKNQRFGEKFQDVQERTVKVFSKGNDSEDYLHQISNLALIDVGQNATLSNYVFAAKRDLIVNMDKEGKYIPFCTKMVFFKYYTKAEDVQVYFWGEEDRNAYLDAIKAKLSDYLQPNENA